ncbi:NADP-dependent glyceraldehyde-3-phosphate dehydrogenase [Clostridium tagluense]|uniref:NADP-dependent glyceraldehyde-3-phosphate dehydrogenase n=1 Tax=Clostridium tagluense TaxID=360422 RepID=UPI001C6E2211|nr:NADP-dependent glyceraldehyde-3-phosphate dehydrogenase [Clostridium tagluense]MBW9156751.1 NADP-dependent glyceraldehyde-3-phosphate dehydrogenase [Clostridium tagluense]WLC64908.1 NADP-dependent glyceraldehyde-3-phosphate dehydrogenase [Clostridium tagluense]
MFNSIVKDKNYKNLFNGDWVTSNNTIDILSPVDNSLVGTIPAMSKDEANIVIQNSKTSQKNWANMAISSRASILHKAAALLDENVDYLSQLMQVEIAKDKHSCIAEIKRTADFIRFTADAGKYLEGETIGADNFPGFKKNKISFVTKVPVGVVLAISPFNYPINLSASKIAPALIGGNSVILKPSTQGAISSLHLAAIFHEAGVPHGVINTITGRGCEIGDYLVTHKDINFINFTGSTQVGKHIAVIAGMVPMIMELGGKDAAIVLCDADIESAGRDIAAGAFSYSGQRCTAVKRVLVIDDVADSLTYELMKNIKLLKVGNPEDDCDITPLIDNKAADYVQELIDDALGHGATLLCGNKRNANLVYPTLFDNVTTDMRLAWEEPFGPVLPVIRVKNIKEAIDIANRSVYGLQTSVYTKNIDDAFNIANKLEVGTVQINNKPERGPDHFPFSGTKSSGMGTQGIRYSIEAMTRLKSTVLLINP